MKKIIIGSAVAVFLFTAFGAAGYAYARLTNPVYGTPWYGMMGSRGGMMGYRDDYRGGMMGSRFDRNSYQYSTGEMGKLHDMMFASLAEKLGVSVSELEDGFKKGESLTSIASSKGIDSTKLDTLVDEAFAQTLDQAVKDKILTEEQANWMKERGGGMMFGRGWGGRFYDGKDCPCFDDDGDSN
ncbi:MAG: hypothetical protein GYA12_12400 [Chloroflexi bacterium]|nr:hypothetical protein [Chloroflexota bacterium]